MSESVNMETETVYSKDISDNKDYINANKIIKLKKKLYCIAEKNCYAYMLSIVEYLKIDAKGHSEYDVLMENLKSHYAYATIIIIHTVAQLDNPEFDINALFNFIEPFVEIQ